MRGEIGSIRMMLHYESQVCRLTIPRFYSHEFTVAQKRKEKEAEEIKLKFAEAQIDA